MPCRTCHHRIRSLLSLYLWVASFLRCVEGGAVFRAEVEVADQACLDVVVLALDAAQVLAQPMQVAVVHVVVVDIDNAAGRLCASGWEQHCQDPAGCDIRRDRVGGHVMADIGEQATCRRGLADTGMACMGRPRTPSNSGGGEVIGVRLLEAEHCRLR